MFVRCLFDRCVVRVRRAAMETLFLGAKIARLLGRYTPAQILYEDPQT